METQNGGKTARVEQKCGTSELGPERMRTVRKEAQRVTTNNERHNDILGTRQRIAESLISRDVCVPLEKSVRFSKVVTY